MTPLACPLLLASQLLAIKWKGKPARKCGRKNIRLAVTRSPEPCLPSLPTGSAGRPAAVTSITAALKGILKQSRSGASWRGTNQGIGPFFPASYHGGCHHLPSTPRDTPKPKSLCAKSDGLCKRRAGKHPQQNHSQRNHCPVFKHCVDAILCSFCFSSLNKARECQAVLCP